MSDTVNGKIKKLPRTELTGGESATDDVAFMTEALSEARAAAALGEVPVGAVIVRDGRIVGRGRNARELEKNALAHAEITAIDEACRTLGGWRLPECTLYVTLEPCPMCAGAIVNARLPRVVCAVKDSKAGAFGSVLNLNSYPLNHSVDISYGICAEEASALLSDFFKALREKRAKKAARRSVDGVNPGR